MENEKEDTEEMTQEEILELISEFALHLFEESELKDNEDNIHLFWSWHIEASRLLGKKVN